MSQNYSREWTTGFEREKHYFEDMPDPFEDWRECRVPEGEAESCLTDGLVILYSGGPIPLAQRFLKAAIEVVSRAFREGKIATCSAESIDRPFPRNRARALRALNYSKALLGETGGLEEGLRDASDDYWAWCEGYSAGDWDSQAEAYLLAGVRLALAAGEPLSAGDLLEKRSSYTWHARESALLGRVVEVALLRQVWGDELRNAFREYFDIVRAPDYRPPIFFETAIARFELGAILVGYCEGQTAEIDWRKVLRVVAE